MTGRKKLVIGVYSLMAVALGTASYLVLTGDDGPRPAAMTTTSTTIAAGPQWPLTGVSADAGPRTAARLERPPVAVKVSNSSASRPQVGINQADQVWEEQVEGISRLIAVFHSVQSMPVGPIRSARDTDVDLLTAFGVPVLVWGGGNAAVAVRVAESPLVSFNVDRLEADSYRDPERTAPDNLFIESTEPFSATECCGTPPVAQFTYRAEGEVPAGRPSLGAEVDWGGTRTAWLWDEVFEVWLRFQDDSPHVDSDDELVAPPNVVLLITEYGEAPSDSRSPFGLTVGEGDATVLTAGHAVTARWRRPTADAPYEIVDPVSGVPIELTKGRTWVGLTPPGSSAFLDDTRAIGLRASLPVSR
jgi:hypothetical protein